jgi:hypothetical protein
MLDVNPVTETKVKDDSSHQKEVRPAASWETPKLEDVSEQVMAQPYIRFT